MKLSATCQYCPRQFFATGKKHFAQGRLKANLSNHLKFSHPEHYVPKVKPGSDFRAMTAQSTENPAKRPYTRKARPESSVNFCPGCGCNLRAVKVAMGL